MDNKQPAGSDHLAPVNSNASQTSQMSENSLLTSSLVTNSQLDASVSPYIPQSVSMSYNNTHQYYGGSASNVYHGVQYPPAMQPVYADTEDYSSDAGAMHETNTSVPPPAAVTGYDGNTYPVSYAAVQPAAQYYMPHSHQQVLQPHMYPTQYYAPYPMANPHQEYYSHDGPGAREEAPEGPDGSASCGGDRRRSSLSVSSCSSAAAVPPGPASPGTMDGPTPHQGEAQLHAAAVVSAPQYSLPSYHQSQKPLLHPPASLAPQHQPTLSSMTAKHARHPAAPYGGGAAAAAAAAATCMVHVQNSHVSLSLFPSNQGGMVPFNTGLVQHPNAAGHLAAGGYTSGVPTNLVPQLHVASHQQQRQINAASHLAYMNVGTMMDHQQQQHSAASASAYHRAQQQRHAYRNEDMNSNKQPFRGGTAAGRSRGMTRGGRGGTNPAVNRSRRSDSFVPPNDRNSFSGNERNSFSGVDRMNTNDDRGPYENNSFANNDHGDRDYGQPMNYVQFHQVPFNHMSKKLEGHPLFVHNVPMVPASDHMANYVAAYQPYLNQPPPGNDMPTMINSHIPPPQTTQFANNFNEQSCHVYNNVQNKEIGHLEQTLENCNNGVVQEPLAADGNGNVSEAPPHGANTYEPSNGDADAYSPIPHNAMAHECHEDQLCAEQVCVSAPVGLNNVCIHSSLAPTPLQEQFSELSVSQNSLSSIPSSVPASDVQLSNAAAASPVPEAVSPTCDVTMSSMTGESSLPTNEAVTDVPTASVSGSPLPTAVALQSSANFMFPEALPTSVAASSTLPTLEGYSFVQNGIHELARGDASLCHPRVPIMDTHSGQECNLPFEYMFGDISAQDLCMEINKTNNGDLTLKGMKCSEKKLDSTPSKSKKSPLFDTSVHNCDAIAVPFTSGHNTMNTMTESPGFQFICTDVTFPAHISLATSLVFTSRSLPKETLNSSTISYPVVASNLPVQSEIGSSLSAVKPASAAAKQQQTAPSRRESAPVAVTCPPQVAPDHTLTSEKPPVPPKKSSPMAEQASPAATPPSVAASTGSQAAAAMHTTPQHTTATTPQHTAAVPPQAATAGGASAWQKQKNWKEHLTGEKKRIAVVSPYNGTVSGPGLSSDGGAELTSVSGGGSMLQGFAGAVTNGPSAHLPPKAEAVQLQLDAAVLEGDRTKIGEFLVDYKPDYSSVTLQPRGLTNKNYWCYSNTVLQAVVCIPQFVNLYRKMDELLGCLITPHTLPVTHSIIAFIKEFAPMNVANINLNTRSRGKKGGQNIVNLPEIHLGDPFEPSSIHKMLLEKTGGQFMEGLQQDAEEMLTFLLNAGHDEFTECLKLAGMKDANKSGKIAPVTTNVVVLPNGQADDSNEAWVTMGPKNKSCITRTTQFSHSPISKIFWGESRSIIRKGNSPVTANLEPFITLPLDIQDEKITSVKDALEQFVSKADVAGYTCTDTREELTVSNQRLLEQLPEVLILQLKRFVYSKDGGLQKVVKDVALPIDLEITKDLISVNNRKRMSADKNKYKLISIVYHDGKEASKGHYVCDVFHSGYNCWLHYDDACVKPIASAELQRCNAPRVPYLLFYRREDTFIDGVFPTAAPPSNALNKRRTKDKRNSSADAAESIERNAVSENRVDNSVLQQQLPSATSVPDDKSSGGEDALSVGNDAKPSLDRKNSLDRKRSNERKANQNPPKTSNKRQDVKKGSQAKKSVTTKNANSS